MRLCALAAASCAALLLFSEHCLAHRVNVFAFVDGGAIRVEGGFAGGKKVNGGKVVAADAETGEIIFEGATDARGECSFRPSDEFLQTGHALTITLLAGEGHRDDWTMAPEELRALSPAKGADARDEGAEMLSEKRELILESDGAQILAGTAGISDALRETRAVAVDAAELEAIVGKVVDEKLLPVKRALARSMDGGPTLRDVVGGVGWILGLLGLATYMKYRGRKRHDDGI